MGIKGIRPNIEFRDELPRYEARERERRCERNYPHASHQLGVVDVTTDEDRRLNRSRFLHEWCPGVVERLLEED